MEKNICRNEAIIKLSELSSYLAYISFSYSKYPSISKLFKYFPRKPSVSQNLPMEKNIYRNEAIIKLSKLSSYLAYISFSYSKYLSISKVFKYFPRKPSVSQNLPMEKNICRNEAIIKLSELSSYLAYISFSYSKYPSISKLFKYFPRKPSVSQHLPMEKNICRNEAIIKLSELSSYLAYISFSYSKYPSISKLFKYFPRKPSVSQNLPMEKNICRNEAIIKLSELSSYLASISFSYSKYPSISKLFKYFPRKPSVSQNLPMEKNICRNEAIIKLSKLSSYLAYISFSYNKYPSISKLFKYFPRKPSVSQNLPMEKNICRNEAIIKLSKLSSYLAYISFSYSKYPSISKLFKYFPRKPSVSQNLPMEKNIYRNEAIIKLSKLSSYLAYISFSYNKYLSISKVFKYFPRKPSVSQNLPMEKNICRNEAIIKLSELSSYLAYISFSYSKYPSISKLFKYFPRKHSVSQNLPMEKNICRNEAIIKLSELSSYLAYISFSYCKYPSISKVFKYFPRKPSVSQNLPMEKNICRNQAIIKLSELSSYLAYNSFSYSKYPSNSKLFKYFPRKPSISQNLPMEKNIYRNEAIIKLSKLSSYLAYISFSYSKYLSISKVFKYFPRKPSVSQNLPMEKNICRNEAIIKLSELSSYLAYISFSYSKYPSISKLFKYFPRKPSVSQNLPMEKNICRNEAIIKLSELSSYLAYISFSYSKYPSISKLFKYFPRKPSVSQNLPMEKNIYRNEAIIKLSKLSSYLAYISFSYSKYPSISKLFKYFPRKPSVSQNLPMEKNIYRNEAIIKLSKLSSYLAYISFSYSKYPSISKLFKYFPRKPSVSQNLPMEKNIYRNEAIIKLSKLSSYLAYISFSYSKYLSISKVFKYFPRKPSVSQNLPMEKNICRNEAIIKLSELSSYLANISFSYSKYPSISKLFKYFPRKPSISQNLPMEENICRNEAIIKLSELSSYLAYISFSYSKYPSISKLFKYFPRKPSVSQNLPMEKNICRNEAIIKLSELSSYLAYVSFSYSKNQSISK